MPDKLKNFSATPASNNSAPPNGAPEGMTPSNVNNVIRENMARVREWYEDAQWIDHGHTINSFTGSTVVVAGDQSAYYKVDGVVRIDSTNLAIITGVSVASDTTITVAGYTILATPTTLEVGIVTADSLAKIGYNGKYVKVESDGDVLINATALTITATGASTIGGNNILTTASEGAGNGLDADQLDGQEGTYYLDRANHTGTNDADTLQGQTISGIMPTGSVIAYAANSTPTGYLHCDGTAVSRTTYSDLFAVVGTTYGVGDGSTTFNLPDLRGEFLRGYDDGRAVDTGRVFASAQGAAALFTDRYEMTTGAGGTGLKNVPTDGTAGDWLTSGRNDGGNRAMRFYSNGETDTRPRNIAMRYIIKT